MDVLIVCHTEFGYSKKGQLIFNKDPAGVSEGVPALVEVIENYKGKITFAICPEVVRYFPKKINHEMGLHIHPGWKEIQRSGMTYRTGDAFLKEYYHQSIDSVALRDYPYFEQLEMIKLGKELIKGELSVNPRIFVAGKWSINNDTIKALVECGFTHDCSPLPKRKFTTCDWSQLPRICMPYHPREDDYQLNGPLPLLIVPTSQMFPQGVVSPELVQLAGLSWLKACFVEYYEQQIPLFHVTVHSPSMTDPFYVDTMSKLIDFITGFKDINFKYASQICEYKKIKPKTYLVSYLKRINKHIIKTALSYGIDRLKNR
ncbi:PTS alpha-glucoside transporter subunit IIBC [Chloroflexota bacterium]